MCARNHEFTRAPLMEFPQVVAPVNRGSPDRQAMVIRPLDRRLLDSGELGLLRRFVEMLAEWDDKASMDSR